MKNQQIIDKIQKLLALANSSNEHESQAAARMAQTLLTKHNLTMTEIEKESSDYTSELVDTGRQRQDPAWKFIQSLLREFFFIEIVQTKRKDMDKNYKIVEHHCYVIFGQPHNVIIAKYVRDFLTRSFRDLFLKYKKESGRKDASRNSFYLGVFKGLHEQLKSARMGAEEETGLVVVKDSNLHQFIQDSLNGKLKSVPSKIAVQTDGHALNAGYEEGRNMRIAMGLGGNETKKVGETLKLGDGSK
jgi:polyhydroxyalkanoate synthesis regulator phasin